MFKPLTVHTEIKMWLRAALIVVGCFGIIRGVRYFTALDAIERPLGVDLLSTYIPVDVWCAAWIAAGLFAFFCAIDAKPSGSLPVVGLCAMWAVGYTVSWVLGVLSMPPGAPARGDYLGASTYWTVALLLVCGYFLARRALKGSQPVAVP